MHIVIFKFWFGVPKVRCMQYRVLHNILTTKQNVGKIQLRSEGKLHIL